MQRVPVRRRFESASDTVFVRHDGHVLRVIEGFRERVLSGARLSVQPKRQWTADDYAAAADAKVRRSTKTIRLLKRWGLDLEGAHVLEVGCGPGIDCILLALRPVDKVVGIDLTLPLFDDGDHADRIRRLTGAVLEHAGFEGGIERALARLPVRLAEMDATRMDFPDHSFDFLYSRAAMEHLHPLEAALAEMARVVRPGGLIYHRIDPFFWLKGCHKGGLVDVPWAHARLSAAEYRRFVAEYEGEARAEKRSRRLASLNQLTLEQWRGVIEDGPFEILDWREDASDLAEALLSEHRDVEATLLPNVDLRDLVRSCIRVWLRRKADP
jgi:SAM-dependent methyltransferase